MNFNDVGRHLNGTGDAGFGEDHVFQGIFLGAMRAVLVVARLDSDCSCFSSRASVSAHDQGFSVTLLTNRATGVAGPVSTQLNVKLKWANNLSRLVIFHELPSFFW
jgi:hypothetical protein